MVGFTDRVRIDLPFSAAYTQNLEAIGAITVRPNFPLIPSSTETTSYSEGFSASDSAKFPGIPNKINRQKLNQYAYICTIGAYRHQHGRVPRYNAELASAIGGYPKGAMLRCVAKKYDAGFCETVISVQDNNTVNPETYDIGSKLNGKVWWKYVRVKKPKSMPRVLPQCNTVTKLSSAKKISGQKFAFSGSICMDTIPTRLIGREGYAISDSSYGVYPQGTQVPLLSPSWIEHSDKYTQCTVSE